MIGQRTVARIGAFELLERIAEGGFGEVWRGRHASTARPVAVKRLLDDLHDDPAAVQAFRAEVDSVAGLSHPGIVTIFDYGVAPLTGEGIEPHAPTPYLVMDYVRGGALTEYPLPLPWPTLKAVLREILQALAHAHARGLVHLDMKPENCLLQRDRMAWARVVISDFGTARRMLPRARAEAPEEFEVVGTPAFMSPEQCLGDWREIGPWTDLYALGLGVYQLATGEVPVMGDTPRDIAIRHVRGEIPSLPVERDLPPELAEWYERMTRRMPEQRFRCAADALAALDRIDADAPIDVGLQWLEARRRKARLPAQLATAVQRMRVSLATRTSMGNEFADLGVDLASGDGAPPTAPSTPALRAELPDLDAVERWHRNSRPSRGEHLVGAGLGLFELRTVPLIGREEEQARLWGALRQCARRGTTSIAVLEGAAGVGKTRLAAWLSERAEEHGVATVLHARFNDERGESELTRMVRRVMRAEGLADRAELERRCARFGRFWHSDDDRLGHELLALLDTTSEPGEHEGEVALATPLERLEVVRRFISTLAADRPVVLWLDEVARSEEGMHMLEVLLDHADTSTVPVCVVATIRSESLGGEGRTASRLHAILRRDVLHVAVRPLPLDDHLELVHALVGLENDVARELAERTAGNPLFATQLVSDWIQRGILVPGDHGFRLAEEAPAPPADLRSLWEGRVSQVLDEFERTVGDASRDQGLRALEVAALLGSGVDDAEWRWACADLPAGTSDNLLDILVARRLATRTRDGWEFAHAMLREVVERTCVTGNRAAALHLRCVLMLLTTRAEPTLDERQRIAQHLYLGGQGREAMLRLLEVVRQRHRRGELDVRWSLARRLRRMVDEQRLTPEDPLSIQISVELATATRQHVGRSADLIWVLEGAVDRAWNAGDAQTLVRALVAHSEVRTDIGDLERGEGEAREALEIAKSLHDPVLHAMAARAFAARLVVLGRRAEAVDVAREAVALADATGDDHVVLEALATWVRCCRSFGLGTDGGEALQRMHAVALAAGHRPSQAAALHAMAEDAIASGDYDRAESLCYEERDLRQRMGGTTVHTVALLARVYTLAGRHRAALEAAEEAIEMARRGGIDGVELAVRLTRWPSWVAARTDMESQVEAEALVARLKTAYVYPELVRAIEVVGTWCEQHGLTDEALVAYRYAAEHFETMGYTDAAQVARTGAFRIVGTPGDAGGEAE